VDTNKIKENINLLQTTIFETPEETDLQEKIISNLKQILIINKNKEKQKKSHVTIGKISYYMDGYLKENLDHLIQAVERSWDGVIIVDGIEGSGKTTFTISMAHYVSNSKFSLQDIFYAPEDFEKWVDSASIGSVGIWDEFVLGGMSEEALTKMQITIIKKMTLIRKKRLIIFLLIPYIFMLRTYFAVGRPRALIHVYTPDGITRGYFRFYNYHEKRELYFRNKKTWAYPKNRRTYSFGGRFTDYEDKIISATEYEEKKDKAISQINSRDSALAWKNKVLKSVTYLWTFIREEHPDLITQKNLGEWFGVTDRQIRNWLTEGRNI
jgi:hypothetical protein